MNPNALIKLGTNALTNVGTNALTNTGTSALSKLAQEATTKALTNSLTRGLTGAGISSLAPRAGSTLDGILGRSSGLVLPNAEKPITTSLADAYANSSLAKTAEQELAERAVRNSNLLSDMDTYNSLSWDIADDIERGGKSKVFAGDPLYDELYDIAKKQKVSPDVFDKDGYLTKEGTEIDYNALTPQERAKIGSDAQDSVALISDYEAPTLENELDLNPDQLRLIDQETAPANEMKIGVDKVRTRKKNIDVALGNKEAKVAKPVATTGVEETTVETANPELTTQIAELRSQIGGAGGGNGGGNVPPVQTPGSDGFNVKLKEGKTTNVPIGSEAVGSTRQQRAVRKLDDMTAKSMNASSKQYKGIVGKSGSIDGHYRTVAERMRAEKIDQANVADKAQAALSLREDIKQQGLSYAEANGVTMDLSNIDNSIGLSATQKRKLAELGLGLDDMLGGNKVVTPTQAENIYKTLRDYAYNWSDSKDALTKMAGNACEKEAEAVRDIIDNTMDNINVDYKTSLIEDAAKNGEDPAYLRKLAGKKDFKFSDLRKDQSDWIAINDLAGNKIKEGPTLNVFGIDTGATNPFTAGAEKIKEKFYERQAYGGGGAGGNGGSGSVPPTGGTGAENSINFTPTGERAGMLGNLLGKAKGAGLVGAGVLGGLMLGGGGAGNNGGGTSFADMTSALAPAEEETEEEIDPYAGMTIGGYDYETLENGYLAALQAGDTDAAKLIANMMGMLEDKVDRYNKAVKNSGTTSGNSGIASKQKAAMNVLSGLMNNYQAQGPIGGRITQFLNTITGGGYNPAVSAYDTGSAGALGTIIKALGDTGALSEGDQKRALELLPKTTDSENAARYKYQQLMQILQGAGAQ